MAAMLVWAATGGAGVQASGRGRGERERERERVELGGPRRRISHRQATDFVDGARVAEGELQSAFLHGALNGTNRAVPGVRRWRSMTTRFPEGVRRGARLASRACACARPSPFAQVWPAEETDALSGPLALMSVRDLLPSMPPALFWPELRRWVGRDWRGAVPPAAGAVWATECPGERPLGGQSDLDRLIFLINHGAQQVRRGARAPVAASSVRERRRALSAAERYLPLPPELRVLGGGAGDASLARAPRRLCLCRAGA